MVARIAKLNRAKDIVSKLDEQGFRHGLLLVALVLFGPLLSGWHTSQERHVVCTVHQRVEHANAPHTANGERFANSESPSYQLLGVNSEAEPHEGCVLAPALREHCFVGESHSNQYSRLTTSFRIAPRKDDRGYSQVALLRLAPKQSPPV